MNKYYFKYKMPWGDISIAYNEKKQIIYCSLSGEMPLKAEYKDYPELIDKLSRYSKGEDVEFNEQLYVDDKPPFTKSVLLWLQKQCLYGQTVTYGDVAKALGKPKAARAVGQAMARNSLPLFVP